MTGGRLRLTRKRGCAVFVESFASLGNTRRLLGCEPLLRLHTTVFFYERERLLGRIAVCMRNGKAHGFGGRAELRETLSEPDGSLSTVLAVFWTAGNARNGDEF